MATQTLTKIARGDTYQLVEWILLEAHSHLLEILLSTQKDNTELIIQRCQRLSALVKRATIPQNAELLSLQFQVCKYVQVMWPQLTLCSISIHFISISWCITGFSCSLDSSLPVIFILHDNVLI